MVKYIHEGNNLDGVRAVCKVAFAIFELRIDRRRFLPAIEPEQVPKEICQFFPPKGLGSCRHEAAHDIGLGHFPQGKSFQFPIREIAEEEDLVASSLLPVTL